jgi:hypothetical protein
MLELETKLAAMKVKIDAMKPSDWLQAMIDGLRQAKSDPHWKVDMKSYGYWESGGQLKTPEMCFGCAATATFMLMLDTPYMALVREHGKSVSDSSSYADLISIAVDYNQPVDLGRIEVVIDRARSGMLNPLFRLCGHLPLNIPEMNCSIDGWNNRWSMCNYNWEDEISKVESVIAEMKLAGY